jgi:hypothetical protein
MFDVDDLVADCRAAVAQDDPLRSTHSASLRGRQRLSAYRRSIT